jgi:hypothetical protein
MPEIMMDNFGGRSVIQQPIIISEVDEEGKSIEEKL